MADILTQSEIDSLISTLVDSKETAKPVPREERQKPTRAYDFRRPDKFSKEQLRSLQVIHENMVRGLSTYFSATFRTVVQMVVGSVDQSSFSDFLHTLPDTTVLCPFGLKPLQGTCLLDINPGLAFPMLDRLLGGPGTTLEEARSLTDIEKGVMRRVVSGILNALRDAWSNILKVEPEVADIETNPLYVQVAAPNDVVVTVSIDVRIGEHVGVITLCLPYLTLEPILAKLSAKNWFAGGVQKEADVDALQQRLATTTVPIVIELGRTYLSVREILELMAGDILVLDRRTDQPLIVRVDDRPKFTAEPGSHRGRLAVRIRDALGVEEGLSDYE